MAVWRGAFLEVFIGAALFGTVLLEAEGSSPSSSSSAPVQTSASPLLPSEEILRACFDNVTEGAVDVKPYRPLTFISPGSGGQTQEHQLVVKVKSPTLQSKPAKISVVTYLEPNSVCRPGSSANGRTHSNGGNGTSQTDAPVSLKSTSLALISAVDITVLCVDGFPQQLRKAEHVDVTFPAKIDFVNDVAVCTSLVNASDVDWWWTTNDCRAVYATFTHVTCRCDQLTTIALKRAPKHYKLEGIYLLISHIVEKCLGALSVICVLIMMMVFFTSGALESQLAKIQIYIAVSIGAAHITSLVGFNFTSNLSVCSAVAAVLQYLFTVYGIWLVVHTAVLLHTCYVHGKTRESTLIAVKVPKGENTEKVGLVRIFLAAWGAPLIVMVILFTKIPYAFGSPESCWLLFTELVYKAFLASVWFAAMVNLVLACVTGYYFRKTESQSKANDDEYTMWLDRLWNRLRLYLPSSVVLTFTLATTWTFHALYKMNPLMTYEYLFQVFNMSQGTLMFVLFCMLNPEVRTVIYRRSRSRLTNDSGTSAVTKTE